jgi:sn-glycerol 3-phosphate transport system substrate-binding protein
MLRKRIIALAALVAILATFAASAADNRPAVRGPDGKIKLAVWFAISGANGEAFKKQVEAFNASQDKIVAEAIFVGSYADAATKMSTALEAKTEPNVALMAAGPLYTGGMDSWVILDYLGADEAIDAGDIYPGMWEYNKYQGKVAGIPYNISTPLLYFNKDILKAAGVDYSRPPRSWEELLALAKKAQAGGNVNKSDDFWGFDVSDAPWLFKAMLMQNGNPVVEADQKQRTRPVFDRADAVEAAAFWKRLVDDKVMPAYQHANAEKRFLAGNLAFIVGSSARISRWSVDAKFGLGAWPLPYFQKPSVPLGGGGLILLDKGAEANDASWKLIRFLLKPEVIAEFSLATGYVPIRKSALEMESVKKAMAANPIYRTAFDQLKDAWAYWHFNEMGTMDLLLGQALERLEKGKQSPAEALAQCARELLAEMQ